MPILDPNGMEFMIFFLLWNFTFESNPAQHIEILNITQLIATWKEKGEMNPVENHESWMNPKGTISFVLPCVSENIKYTWSFIAAAVYQIYQTIHEFSKAGNSFFAHDSTFLRLSADGNLI